MKIKQFYKAESLNDAYHKLLENNKNAIVGGGAWIKQGNKEIETLIDLENLRLNKISESTKQIEIGAMVTLRQLETNPIILSYANGMLSKAIKSVMGIGIRNLATIGGSVIGKYSFSDILTPLLALDVSLVFHKSGVISLSEFVSTKKPVNDILVQILIKKETISGYFYKMSKTALDFAVVNIAVSKSDKFKVVIGARPSIAILAKEVMEVLNNNSLNDVVIESAIEKVNNIKFSSNSKASKEYRAQIAKVYIKRGILEVMKNES